jgi:hypothetical protein
LTSAGLRIALASYAQYITWTTFLSFALPVLVLAIEVLRPRLLLVRSRAGEEFDANFSLHANVPKLISRAGLQSLAGLSAAGQLLAVAFAACLVILVAVPIGSNVAYFSVVVLMLSLVALPSTLARVPIAGLDRSVVNPLLLTAACVLFAACAYQFAIAGDKSLSGLLRAAWPQRAGSSGARIAESWRATRTPFALLQQRIDDLPWATLMRDLQAKQALPGGLVVNIPPGAEGVWHRLSGGAAYWCRAAHLMIPAQTGIVEIRSIEPKELEGECLPPEILLYGFGKDQDLHRTDDLTAAQLCAAASLSQARWVYVVSSVAQLPENKLIDCRAP